MKICKNCFQSFDETPTTSANPAEVLGDIFLDSARDDNYSTQEGHDLCPSCREALGVVNMLGFGL
jgi:hypothetical protein